MVVPDEASFVGVFCLDEVCVEVSFDFCIDDVVHLDFVEGFDWGEDVFLSGVDERGHGVSFFRGGEGFSCL